MVNFSYKSLGSLALKAFAVAALFGVSGCTRFVGTPVPVDQGSYLVHVVTSNGETVRGLTRWYTGSERVVREVAAVNSVREGIYLKPGQRVLIPNQYVRKTGPPPKQQFSRKAQPRSRKGVVGGGDVEELSLAAESSAHSDSPELATTTVPPGQVEANVTPVNRAEPAPVISEPLGSPGVQPSVVPEELTIDEVLKREQIEVDRLKQELEAGQPAPS